LPRSAGREDVGDDRQGGRHYQRGAHAHQRAHRDDLTGRVGDERPEARQAEDRDAGLQRSLTAEPIAERAEHE
jgi:hypothetical protein